MCLGIPGKIVEVLGGGDVALVDVAGVVREINLGILEGPPVEPGEHILIHSGFALERMSAEQATDALNVFRDGSMTSG